jgi:valyl-tRNA synthetase
MNKLLEYSKEKYDTYDFHNPAKELRHFVWETFSSHYLELVKTRAYNENNMFTDKERNGAVYTLNLVLKKLLQILSPIIPIITYRLYNDLYEKDVHKLSFPETDLIEEKAVDFLKEELEMINSNIWKYKRDNGLSLKDGLRKVKMPRQFAKLEKDLVVAHGIEKIEFGKSLKIEK